MDPEVVLGGTKKEDVMLRSEKPEEGRGGKDDLL
jgi:hypothetical protein